VQQLGVELAEKVGDMPRVALYICLGQTRLAQGRLDEADEVMLKSDEVARRNSVTPAFRARHAAYRVMFAVRRNDLDSAAEWGKRLSEYSRHLGLEFQHVAPRLLISQGDLTTAAEQLKTLYETTVRTGALGLGICVRVYQALCAATPAEALFFISDALTKGESTGHIRTFVDEGRPLTPLLRRALSQGIASKYTAMLLGLIQAEERQQRTVDGEAPSSQNSGPLSERELEVLRLLETGLSNPQIAARIVVSLSTTKTHVHNIMQKLDARTRTEAIARARQLKLI
jgi:LuxR family transcriptional regulator, maltose regulon positive regulatory protein